MALRRLTGPERQAHAAFVAGGLALLVHAGVDWDWEMPALFVWFFGAGGVVLARGWDAPAPAAALAPGRIPRVVAGLACLLVALTPARVAASETRVVAADDALAHADCPTAVNQALGALALLHRAAAPASIGVSAPPTASMAGSRAMSAREPGQVRKEAALSGHRQAMRGRPTGAGGRWQPSEGHLDGGCTVRFEGASAPPAPSSADQDLSSAARRRRIRPPVSRATPPSRTGIARKPVNGRLPEPAPFSACRVGCRPVLSPATPPDGLCWLLSPSTL